MGHVGGKQWKLLHSRAADGGDGDINDVISDVFTEEAVKKSSYSILME